MAYEHKENSGSLFKNDKKTSDKAPDYKGKANIDGVVKDVAAWKNEKGFLSLKFSDPYNKEKDVPF